MRNKEIGNVNNYNLSLSLSRPHYKKFQLLPAGIKRAPLCALSHDWKFQSPLNILIGSRQERINKKGENLVAALIESQF